MSIPQTGAFFFFHVMKSNPNSDYRVIAYSNRYDGTVNVVTAYRQLFEAVSWGPDSKLSSK